MKERKGVVLGYAATLAARQGQLIVEKRATRQPTDRAVLLPMVEGVQQRCGESPAQVSADSDFFALSPLQELENQGVDAYAPDADLARMLNRGGCLRGQARRLLSTD